MAPAEATPRTLLRERVHEQILRAILDGTLQPGARLRDSELTAWLGTSRAPIREALAQLAEVGVVETAPNRFTRVATITPRVYLETAAVWATLVTRALFWGIREFPSGDLGALEAEVDVLRTTPAAEFPPGPTPIDRFLSLILRHCRNRVLLDNIAVYDPLLQLGINSFKRHLDSAPLAVYFESLVQRCADHNIDGFEDGMRVFLEGPMRVFSESVTGKSLAPTLDGPA